MATHITNSASKLFSISKERGLIALFFFLSSCSSPCPQWEFTKIETSCPNFKSAKMFISPENTGTGVELEIARSPSDLRLYLNVFSLKPFPFSEGKVPVIIIINDNRYDLLADRFEGGQRFLLPAEIYCPIIEALSTHTIVTIVLGRYKSDIIALGFPEAYIRLNKLQ